MNIRDEMIPKTFITTIRVDMRDIATIALFLEENGQQSYQKSKGKVASLAVRLMADQLLRFQVKDTAEALRILQALGYEGGLQKGRRDHVPLLKQMARESVQSSGASFQQARDVAGKMEENSDQASEFMPGIKETRAEIKEQQMIDKNKYLAEQTAYAAESMEISPEPPKRTINIPKGAPKNKIHIHLRSEADEQQAIKEQKAGFAGPPPLADVSPEVSQPTESHTAD